MKRCQITLVNVTPTAELIGRLRSLLPGPISVLKNRIAANQPIFDESPGRGAYEAFLEKLGALLEALDKMEITYTIHADGRQKTAQYIRNTIKTFHQIERDTQQYIDRTEEE